MKKPEKVRLLLVDDHPVVIMGLTALFGLEPDIEITATADNGHDAISLYRQHQPDAALLDVKMPALDGIETARSILAEFPAARILMLTTAECPESIGRALELGVAGYLLKDSKRGELTAAIRAVCAGETRLHPVVAKLAEERARQPKLTARQLEVLDYVSKGLTNQEIAGLMGFTEAGAKRHLHHIYQKLGVSSRAEATAEALKNGLL